MLLSVLKNASETSITPRCGVSNSEAIMLGHWHLVIQLSLRFTRVGSTSARVIEYWETKYESQPDALHHGRCHIHYFRYVYAYGQH